MSTRHRMFALAVAIALGAPAAAGAQDLSFNYLEGGYVAGFVNDVEDSWTFTDHGSTFEVETDSGGGGFIGGAWQFWGNVHLFGEYSSASQDLEVSDAGIGAEVGVIWAVTPAIHLQGHVRYTSVGKVAAEGPTPSTPTPLSAWTAAGTSGLTSH